VTQRLVESSPIPVTPADTTDASIWADVPADAPRRLLLAALDSFAERGFHAATTRDIAKRAELSPAAVYVHYRSKAELLFRIALLAHEAVLREVESSLDFEGSPKARLEAFVLACASWHARNHRAARVVQYELRALSKPDYTTVARLRRRVEELIQAELAAGVAAGEFEADDLKTVGRAILSLCIDIARWYEPGRDGPANVLAAAYTRIALQMVAPRGRRPTPGRS